MVKEKVPVVKVEGLRLLVLHYLSKEPMHGYSIMKSINELYGVKAPSPGSLYPLLKELREEGLVEIHEEGKGIGRGGPKVYRLTEKGREYLDKHREELKDVLRKASSVRRFLELGGLELMKYVGELMTSLSSNKLSEEQRRVLREALAESAERLRKALEECGLRRGEGSRT